METLRRIKIISIIMLLYALRISCEECRTPNQTNGTCLPFKECSVIVDALVTQGNTISNVIRRYLNRSVCYYSGKSVHICCPINGTIDQQAIQFPRSQREEEFLPQPPNCGQMYSNENSDPQYANLYEYPWVALIEYSRGDDEISHFCTGSIINKRYVLTAAHCTRPPKNFTLTGVRLGDWDTNTNPDCQYNECAQHYSYYKVEDIIIHSEFDLTGFINDIALIRLADDIEKFTSSIQPICLPTLSAQQNDDFDDKILETTGWRTVDSVSAKKQKGRVKVLSLENCARMYNSYAHVQLTPGQICANGIVNNDYCNGDSGSPLMIQETFGTKTGYVLAGITSFGTIKCNKNDWPKVFTRVGAYIDWIKNNIQK